MSLTHVTVSLDGLDTDEVRFTGAMCDYVSRSGKVPDNIAALFRRLGAALIEVARDQRDMDDREVEGMLAAAGLTPDLLDRLAILDDPDDDPPGDDDGAA